VNALADDRVANYFNDSFISTFMKVGTFQRAANGQKNGGNVASYFCLYDGSVIHAVPGQTSAATLLEEARWAYEVRKTAVTSSTNLLNGDVDMKKYTERFRRAHAERYHALQNNWHGGGKTVPPIPMRLPTHASQQSQAHWLLAKNPLAKLNEVYPIVWTQVLREQLSDLPVRTQ
jgi:hypothetical protein